MITVNTVAFIGIEVKDIEVQVHVAKGQPALTIVGLGDKAIAESRDRIRAVMNSIGLSMPPSKITINLAPADVLKEGTHFDLPIALGIVSALGIIKNETLFDYIALGELSLDGSIRHVNGILPAAIHASINNKGIICPKINGEEAAWAGDETDIIASPNFLSLLNHLRGIQSISRPVISEENIQNTHNKDINDVIGQEKAKRCLEIAAAGGHNMLMIGHPGTGKTMLASRIITILPPLNSDEILEVNMINSVSGLINNGILSTIRPFRNPHHSASMPSIIGGGRFAKPGEITLAHRGILFLDEIVEFPRMILESLRQPLENGEVSISRVHSRVTYPAKFQLIAAMNPCQCGYAGHPVKQCNKIPKCALEYQSKISGPIIDRIDIKVQMDVQNYKSIEHEKKYMDKKISPIIKERIIKARKKQINRYQNNLLNSEIEGNLITEHCMPKDAKSKHILDSVSDKMHLSMRNVIKILKVARTIADLEDLRDVEKEHILEAISISQFYNQEK